MLKEIISTNFSDLFLVFERAIFSLITLFLVTKLIGKKQVSELNLFDYVISISIGNFAAEMTMNLDSQVLNGFIAVVTFGIIATIVSIGTMKSIKLRRFFMGVPTIIIENGKLVYENIKKVKFDMNDFLQTARVAGYFDISNIKYAVMEVNGKVSFLPKEGYQPVINKDMNVKTDKQGLCANVILDGKIMYNNLKIINKTNTWLKKKLDKEGYLDTNKILLATVDINDKLVIYPKKEKINITDVLE